MIGIHKTKLPNLREEYGSRLEVKLQNIPDSPDPDTNWEDIRNVNYVNYDYSTNFWKEKRTKP